MGKVEEQMQSTGIHELEEGEGIVEQGEEPRVSDIHPKCGLHCLILLPFGFKWNVLVDGSLVVQKLGVALSSARQASRSSKPWSK